MKTSHERLSELLVIAICYEATIIFLWHTYQATVYHGANVVCRGRNTDIPGARA
jgi:hypothetical protein